jgi:hypothetical protein
MSFSVTNRNLMCDQEIACLEDMPDHEVTVPYDITRITDPCVDAGIWHNSLHRKEERRVPVHWRGDGSRALRCYPVIGS